MDDSRWRPLSCPVFSPVSAKFETIYQVNAIRSILLSTETASIFVEARLLRDHVRWMIQDGVPSRAQCSLLCRPNSKQYIKWMQFAAFSFRQKQLVYKTFICLYSHTILERVKVEDAVM